VTELSLLLATRMLVLAGVAPDEASAADAARGALASGAALVKFREIVANQGGDARVIDDYGLLPAAPDREPVKAPRGGFVAGIEARSVGEACALLGGGRGRLEDVVDHGVGIEVVAPPGSEVRAGEPVLLVHHRSGRGLDEAEPVLRRALAIADAPPEARPLVLERIEG
jgi:thymidine phosphorylase